MSKIFTRRFRIRYSELGADGWVAASNYLRYLVETAYDWGAANQLGLVESEELGLAWVIRETELEFFHPLSFEDEFDFTIWLMEWRRVRGTRGFKLVLAESGELVAQGAQKVVSLDVHTLRPITPPERFMENFRLESPLLIPLNTFSNEIHSEENRFETRRWVEWRDVDTMDIVYNAVYVDYAEEALRQMLAEHGWTKERLHEQGRALAFKKIQMKYLAPAYWGDELTLELYPLSLDPQNASSFVEVKSRTSGNDVLKLLMHWQMVKRE